MLDKITRRHFLRLAGLGSVGLAAGLGSGCASFPKDVNWASVPDSEFTLEKFDDWFVVHKLYNGINPNLSFGKIGKGQTFYMSIVSGWSPGMDYNSNYFYSAADGSFADSGKVSYKDGVRLTGNYLKIAHPVGSDMYRFAFISSYAHLGTMITLKPKVKRGERIAEVAYTNNAKFMFQRRGNYVDPDNYGINHSYMDYWDGKTNLDIGDEMYDKERAQYQILDDISKHTNDLRLNIKSLFRKEHRPIRENKICVWDAPEIMRYYDELFNARPAYFPKLSPDKFAEYKKEFYANQPIILTLPLKP